MPGANQPVQGQLDLYNYRRLHPALQIVHDFFYNRPVAPRRLGQSGEERLENGYERAGVAPALISDNAARAAFPRPLSSLEYFRLTPGQKRQYNMLRPLLGYPRPTGGNVELQVFRRPNAPHHPGLTLKVPDRPMNPEYYRGVLRTYQGPVNIISELDELEPGIPVMPDHPEIGYKKYINGAIEVQGVIVNNRMDHLFEWEAVFGSIMTIIDSMTPLRQFLVHDDHPQFWSQAGWYRHQVRIGISSPEIDDPNRVFYYSLRWTSLNELRTRLARWLLGKMQEYNLTIVKIMTLGYHIIPLEAIGLGRSWAAIQDKYALVSFRSQAQCVLRTFCFLKGLYSNDPQLFASFNWKDVSQYLAVRVNALIKELEHLSPGEWKVLDRVAKIGVRGMEWDQIEYVAEHLDAEVQVFNNIFQKIRTLNEGGRSKWEVMVLDSHMVAAVPLEFAKTRGDLVNFLHYSTFSTLKLGKVAKTIDTEIQRMQAKETKKIEQTPFSHARIRYARNPNDEFASAFVNRQFYYGTYDFETYENPYTQELVTYAGMYYVDTPSTEVQHAILERNCASALFTKLHSALEPFVRATKEDQPFEVVLFAHNGAKFDSYIVLTDAIRDDPNTPWQLSSDNASFVVIDQALVCMDLISKTYPNLKVRLLDSMRHLVGSLASITKEFKVPHQKLTELFSHCEVDDEFIDNAENQAMVLKYLENDVIGLYECITAYRRKVWDAFKVSLGQCMTAASLSKAVFLQNFYNPKEFPLFNLDPTSDGLIRAGFFGGRCECGFQGYVQGPIYVYDFTSLYPYAGSFDLPYGKMKVRPYALGLQRCLEGRTFRGFLKVDVRSKIGVPLKRPLHGCRIDGKLVFPHFQDWCTIVMFHEEYYAGVHEHGGYEYRVHEGYEFEFAPFMKVFFQTMTDGKKAAKLAGDKVMEKVLKLIANSGYGWTAFRSKGKRAVEIHDAESNMHAVYMLKEQLVDYCPFRDDMVMIAVEKDAEVTNFNVSIGAAITSRGRLMLWRVLDAIDCVGKNIYYKDTDSVFTNCNFADYPELCKKFMWDYDGVDANTGGIELGSLKSEGNEIVSSPEFVAFDEGIFLLPKLYAVRKRMDDGTFKYKGGSKGFSRKEPVRMVPTDGDRRIPLFSGAKQIGVADRIERSLNDNLGNKLVFNEPLVNEDFQELDRKTWEVRRDEFGNPYYRGPPNWDDFLKLAEGHRITRTMDSLTTPFKNIMTEDSRSILKHSLLTRTTGIVRPTGENCYTKGTVRNGKIEPLWVPLDNIEPTGGPMNLMNNPFKNDGSEMEALRKQHERWAQAQIVEIEKELVELDDLLS